MQQTRMTATLNSTLYASDGDFCRIFAEDMNSLHLLALLLTADSAKAEQCFVRGLEQCGESSRVFKEWAHSWARRRVVQNAIALTVPRSERHSNSGTRIENNNSTSLPSELSVILQLGSFDRFVFVMSVLESYSDHECALFLACSRADVATARARALWRLGEMTGQLRGQQLTDNLKTVLRGAKAGGPPIAMRLPVPA
jgi:hypothetical protein